MTSARATVSRQPSGSVPALDVGPSDGVGTGVPDRRKVRLDSPTWLLIVLAMVATVALFPTGSSVFYMDDWDFLAQRLQLPLAKFLFAPTEAGHVLPFTKAYYALVLSLGHFDTTLFPYFQIAIRWTTIAIWFGILKRIGAWSLAGGIVLICIAASEVGAAQVYYWGIQSGQEFAYLFFSAAVYLMVRGGDTGKAGSFALAAAFLFLGVWSWGIGLVAPIAVLLALLLVPGISRSPSVRRTGIALMLTCVAVTVLVYLTQYSAATGAGATKEVPLGHLEAVGRFWFYLAALNSALGGMYIGIPGYVTGLFFVILMGTAGWAWHRGDERQRFVLVTILLMELGTTCLIALTRWHKGVAYAGSYRYVYNNVALQLMLLATVVGLLLHGAGRQQLRRGVATGLGLCLFALGVAGGVRGRTGFFAVERQRQACLNRITADPAVAPPCAAEIHESGNPAVVRDVWLRVLAARQAAR